MTTQLTPPELLQKWCRDAVERHGDNWSLIEAYVRERLAELSEAERQRVTGEISLMLAATKTNMAKH